MTERHRSRYIALSLIFHLVFFIIFFWIVRPIVQELRHEQALETLLLIVDENEALEDPQGYVEEKTQELSLIRGSFRLRLEDRETGNIYEAKSEAVEQNRLISFLQVPQTDAEYIGDTYHFSLRMEGGLLSYWRLTTLIFYGLSAFFIFFVAFVFLPRSLGRYVTFIGEVTEEMYKLAEGEAGDPLPIDDDELGDLARAYNHLRNRLGDEVLEMQKANTLLNGILEAMRDGVLVINEEGRLVVWTERALKFLGDDVAGDNKLQRASKETGLPLFAAIGSNAYMLSNLVSERFETMRLGEAQKASIRLHWPSNMTLDLYLKILFVDGKKHLLIVLHDKTRVVQLENYRRDFVANITHELKTPLTSIRGYTELLLLEERSRETQLAFLEIIDDEASRLAELIQDLLLIAEIEGREGTAPPVKTYVLPILEDCFRSQEAHAYERGIRLTQHVDNNAKVPLTRDSLRQVLTNLVSNAVRYIDEGGQVDVYMKDLPDEVQLIVEDDGPGIDAKHRQRIFERFYRVHKERSRELGGTGLGLSIVKNMVEAVGGHVELTTNPGPGIGCQFVLRFPKPDAASDSNPSSDTPLD